MIMLGAVNWMSVLLATLAALVIGYIWYHNSIFGAQWSEHTKVTSKSTPHRNSLLISVGTLLVAFVKALFIAILVEWVAVGQIMDGFLIVGGVWGAMVVTSYGNHYLIEQRSFKLFLINAVHDLVVFVAITATIIFYDYQHFK